MNVRPPAWDKYEAVILLEGMIDIKQHDMPRNIVVERVSQDLRKMARNRGIEIDELFRNVNGIAFQLQSMESAYCGYTVFKPASKLFTEIAGVYKTDHFGKGFRMESSLEIRRFRKYYSAINGKELEDSDELITQNISKICLLYDGKAYLPDIMLREDLKESLLHYIDESFVSGKEAVYFQALYNKFSEDFLDSHIHDADMLRAYLMHLGLKNVFFNRNFIAKKANVEIDPLTEVRDCLREHARPMAYEEIFSELSHLPASKIKFILASNLFYLWRNGER